MLARLGHVEVGGVHWSVEAHHLAPLVNIEHLQTHEVILVLSFLPQPFDVVNTSLKVKELSLLGQTLLYSTRARGQVYFSIDHAGVCDYLW